MRSRWRGRAKGGSDPPGCGAFAIQVHAVVQYVGDPVHLIGFSWGGATALHVAATAPAVLASVAVIEPEAYSLLKAEDGPAFAAICGLRDQWREHVRAGRWYEAFEAFVDFYNGPGSFARWPATRRDTFLADQRARGDLWDVHVVEGSATSVVDRAICAVVRGSPRCAEHSVIEGAGHMMPLTHAADLSRALVRRLP
jgi:lipase